MPKLNEKEYAQIPIAVFAAILIIPVANIISNGIFSDATYMSLLGELVTFIQSLVAGSKGKYYLNSNSLIKTMGVVQLINLLAIIGVDVLAFFVALDSEGHNFHCVGAVPPRSPACEDFFCGIVLRFDDCAYVGAVAFGHVIAFGVDNLHNP